MIKCLTGGGENALNILQKTVNSFLHWNLQKLRFNQSLTLCYLFIYLMNPSFNTFFMWGWIFIYILFSQVLHSNKKDNNTVYQPLLSLLFDFVIWLLYVNNFFKHMKSAGFVVCIKNQKGANFRNKLKNAYIYVWIWLCISEQDFL